MADLNVSAQVITSSQALIRLEGAVDTVNFHRIEEEFAQVLQSSAKGLVLDATRLEAATSAALGAMANLTRVMKERSGKLAIVMPAGEVRTLVEMLGLESVLEIHDNPDSARKALADVK